jgi:hypothetical protein
LFCDAEDESISAELDQEEITKKTAARKIWAMAGYEPCDF